MKKGFSPEENMNTGSKFTGTVSIDSKFWNSFRDTVRHRGIPYQWDALNDRLENTTPSYCMRNFRIASGKEKGEHGGYVFQDSDVAKWLESVAYALASQPDPELEAIADSAIDDIVAAQQPDGYLDTYYIINGLNKRWTNLMDHHELYCAGHLIEAAVAYYRATGKRKLLDAVLRLVDHIYSVFSPAEEKCKGYPGHPVIEMALMKLYDLTGDSRHLQLAKYFIDQRGQSPLYFEEEKKRNNNPCYWDNGVLKLAYYQADKPLREQKDAVGHAVRALYLYSGMADVARETRDKELTDACKRMWESVTERRMYITGAVGSSEYGEAFTFDYDLPNDQIYGETCASCALVFFAQRMLRMEAKAEYADVLERALFNTVLSGMQLDGKSFFYVNPLEVVPEACRKDQRLRHVKPVRQPWFGCACCPPNLNRLLMSLENYIVSVDQDTAYIHTYINSQVTSDLGAKTLDFSINTDYPWDGTIKIRINRDIPCGLALRIPGWCNAWKLTACGQEFRQEPVNGYVHLSRSWHTGDMIELVLEMKPVVIHANPHVYKDIGLAAVMRGPLVYCLEEADNGKDLHLIHMGPEPGFTEEWNPELLGGIVTVHSTGYRLSDENWDRHTLYAPAKEEKKIPVKLKWIPYYAWSNRGEGEMRVWIQR